MNTNFKFIRFAFALMIALGALGISASVALADKPSQSEYTFDTGSDIDVCSFPVHVVNVGNGTEIDYYDQNGALVRAHNHQVEQDTFTANNKTLVGVPFTFNMEVLFDSNGNITHVYADGVTEKIPLPDGSLFVSAGRLDFVAHNFEFVLSPDKGNPGNVARFCAALAP